MAAVQIAPVATHTNVAAGTVYRYFPSKADLISELIADVSDRELIAIRRAADAAPGPSSALAAAITTIAVHVVSPRKLAWGILAEPVGVALPDTTEQVSQALKICHDNGIKVAPRGNGTSLSGGSFPLADGVLLGLSKFKRVREIDFDNRVVVVEPGMTNLAVSQAVAHEGFYYAPDPSSQIACSIGGNIAENSGGGHSLKYGLTTNNVLGCEFVLITGEILKIGGRAPENVGYVLMGIFTGSEGLLGVVTEITVRILKKPETARALMVGFSEVEAAGECVARVIGAGIIPGGMEMMDKDAIHAAEAFVNAGYPLEVEALLIIELDGPSVEVDELIRRVEAIARDCRSTTVQVSNSEQERLLFL